MPSLRWWRMFEIILFLLIIFSFFRYLSFVDLFFILSPAILYFFFLRCQELRKEKTPAVFFFYFLSIGIFYYLFVRLYLKIPFVKSPWLLLLLLFSIYFLIEIFVRFKKQGKFGILISSASFFALYLNPTPFFIIFIPLLLIISLIYENILILSFEYGKEIIKNQLFYKWLRYSYLSIGFIFILFIFLAFLPLNIHISGSRFAINHFFSKAKPSPSPMMTFTPKAVIEKGERIVTLYTSKGGKQLPLWIKKFALWRLDKSLLVDILLLEFGLFALLFLFKIFSKMRYWYIFLGLSIMFTALLVGIFAYIIYIIGSYILRKDISTSPWGNMGKSYPNIISSSMNLDKVTTKTVMVEGGHTLFLSILLNMGLLIIMGLSIVIIFIVILKIINRVDIKNYVEIPEGEIENEDQTPFVPPDRGEFLKILEKDPRYAIEYLYNNVRERFYKRYTHLTPYEFLKKVEGEAGGIELSFLEKITPLFIMARYSNVSPKREIILSVWEDYSAIFFNI